jgi:hypothetical protein
MKGFAIFFDVFTTRRFFVPFESSILVEIFYSGFQAHPTWQSTQDSFRHGKMFAVVMGLKQGMAQS